MRMILTALTALLLLTGCDLPGGSPTNKDRVQDLAEREVGDVGEVEVHDPEQLGDCELYAVSLVDVLDFWPPEYAVLPDDRILSSWDSTTTDAADILRECAEGEPAEQWARVVERFSGKGSGIVVGPDDVGSAERKIEEAGQTYAAPKLEPTAGGRELTYFSRNFEVGTVYHVVAVISDDWTLDVAATEL